MKTKRAPHWDVFVSHSSNDSRFARSIVRKLESDGLKAWIDSNDVRFGMLLRNDLREAIRSSRAVVLLWSKAAHASRWVISEILTAYHLDRFIIPCVLDAAPLPQFLQATAYLDRTRDKARLGKRLSAAVNQAPDRANDRPAFMAAESPEVQEIIRLTARAQRGETDAMQARDLEKAAQFHAAIDEAMTKFEKAYPFEPMILNLAGYHRKNAYLLKHWAANQAGRAPKDPLIESAERFFFETLCVNPMDPSALNGLGSVLILERELDAAEFFVTRALELAPKGGGYYEAALHDLALIRRYKAEAGGSET